MTKRRAIPTAPEPLEAYARSFDDLFGKSNQRDEFRRYLQGLLLPTERNKTLTGLANTEPSVGAQHPRAKGYNGFSRNQTGRSDWFRSAVCVCCWRDPVRPPTDKGCW